MRQGSGGYVQNFKSIRQKNKNFHFGGHFWGGRLRGGELDCGQYQILTDPRNGVKNLCMQFGNDRCDGPSVPDIMQDLALIPEQEQQVPIGQVRHYSYNIK